MGKTGTWILAAAGALAVTTGLASAAFAADERSLMVACMASHLTERMCRCQVKVVQEYLTAPEQDMLVLFMSNRQKFQERTLMMGADDPSSVERLQRRMTAALAIVQNRCH